MMATTPPPQDGEILELWAMAYDAETGRANLAPFAIEAIVFDSEGKVLFDSREKKAGEVFNE